MKLAAVDPGGAERAAKALEVAHVYGVYQDTLRARQSIDFGDLIMIPTLLLEKETAIRCAIQLRHRHVLVDEYQDVNRASARLLRALAGEGSRLWVVGDARQSIYRFRGASSINMTRFSEDFPQATIAQLRVNYRSSQEIINVFQVVAPHMAASEGMLPLSLEADNGWSGIHPQLRRFDTPDDEVSGIAASIRELEFAGVRLRDQAVLCRTNSRLSEIADGLELRGIPVLHLGSLFERSEVRDLLAILTLAVDPFCDGLTRIAAMPRYEIPLQDVHTAVHLLREIPGPATSKLKEVSENGAISLDGRRGLASLATDLEGISSRAAPWEFLASYLLDSTDLLARVATGQSLRDKMRAVAIWQFLNFVRDRSPITRGSPIQRVLDRVRQLVLLSEERDLRQIPAGALHMEAVRLMTVHGSKGLEFKAVHIPGMTKASFPESYTGQRCPPPDGMIEGDVDASASHEMEEECLFFVALSRARKHLRLYHARKQRNGANRSPSPYLEWFTPTLVKEILQSPILTLPLGVVQQGPIRVTWPKDRTLTDSRLRSYEGCPRRFFYTHVLGLGSARKSTAFTRTHDCLYKLIRWLAEARIDGVGGRAEAIQEFDRIWAERGPVDHAYAAQYRLLADRLVEALIRSGAAKSFRRAEPLAIDFSNGRVVVEANEIAELPDGTIVLRRIRTGRRRETEYDELEYTLYHLAGRANYGASYTVEAVHLTDEVFEPADVSAAKIKNRQAKSEAMVAAIGDGHFPPNPDAVRCPRCPHFFVCDAVPRGPLTIL
jgi:DNA helicase-2/ATP-dependent DNA helicase PcrA